MTMYYLSGDDDMDVVNGKRRKARKAKRAAKKQKRKEKRAGKKLVRKKRRASRPRKRRFAKIAGAPVRAAFIAVTRLNLLRTGTKLARVWNKPGGKQAIENTWRKLGGKNISALQKAIAKGSKQTINGDEMGIAAEATIAAATAALIAFAPLIKKFAAQGDKEEAAEYDAGIEQGKEGMANDPNYEQGEGYLPPGKDVGVLKGEGGEEEEDDDTQRGSFFSPVGLCFKILMIAMILPPIENLFLNGIIGALTLYALIGMIFVIPVQMTNVFGLKKYVDPFFDLPASWIHSLSNKFSYGEK